MSDSLTITFDESGIIGCEGLRFSTFLLKDVLNNPPTDCLFHISRKGDRIVFQRFTDAESAAQFFKTLSQATGAQAATERRTLEPTAQT